MTVDLDRLAGRLTLHPGGVEPLVLKRPIIGAAVMRRLTEGRRASLVPDLLGAVFTLCAGTQRMVSRRAILAATGHPEPATAAQDRLGLTLATAREHLQRMAMDWPAAVPVAGVAIDPGWLRDAPHASTAAGAPAQVSAALHHAAAGLPVWLERRLLGMPVADWLAGWQADPERWLTGWAASHDHPLARWLNGVRDAAVSQTLPCRPLALLDSGEPCLRRIAVDLGGDEGFAERPLWLGLPAETGPWTRQGLSVAPSPAMTLWHRLGARIADLAALAEPAGDVAGPACAALTLSPGEGMAWCETSRGLLLHWVRLENGPQDLETARVAAYRVLAPTEWNMHPAGVLAEALRRGDLPAERIRLAITALDPCVVVEIAGEAGHA